jgi:hypothetical protein
MRIGLVVVLVVAVGVGCAVRQPLEERTTQGPTAEQLWTLRVTADTGRSPTFEERRHWEDSLEARIGEYLRRNPDRANALDVSTFRFLKQVAVGMDREQVVILLGPPMNSTTDQGAVEQLARRYWAQMRDSVTEAWEYPNGWRLFFGGPRLVDIVQYLPPS